MDLTDTERQQLIRTLGCEDDDLEGELDKFRAAASEEYIRMILGQRIFTRGQDMNEYRLLLLIRHVFSDSLPTEQQISSLFQTTATQSRSLLRAVMSKYQYELQSSVATTLKSVLEGARKPNSDSDARLITIDSENIVEALNRRIAAIDGGLPRISKYRGTVSTYEIAESAYAELMKIDS